MKLWLTVSTNGMSTRLCHKWNNFCLFKVRFGCGWLWLAEKILHKWRWFFFFAVANRLSCKTIFTINTKLHKCRFLVLERSIHNVTTGFALFPVVKTSRFTGWCKNTLLISTCWTIHISNNLLYFVVQTQFFLSIFDWLKWDIRLIVGYNWLLGTKLIFF